MKGKLSVAEKSRLTRIPKTFVDGGWHGKVPFLANASTIVLIHPKASLSEAETSLRIILEDIKLRKKIRARRRTLKEAG